MKRFKYISHHIPSGQRFEYEANFISEADFLRHLNKWNWQGGGEWVYRSENGAFPPQIPMTDQSRGKRIEDQPRMELDRLAADARSGPKSELDKILSEIPSEGC